MFFFFLFFFFCVTEVYTKEILFHNSIDFGQLQKGISFCSRTLGEGRGEAQQTCSAKTPGTIWFTLFSFVLNAPWSVPLSTWKGETLISSHMLQCGWNAALNTAAHVTHFTCRTWASTAITATLHCISPTFQCTAQVWHGPYGRLSESGACVSRPLYLMVSAAVWKSADRSRCLYWWQARAQRLQEQNQSFQMIVINLTQPLALSFQTRPAKCNPTCAVQRPGVWDLVVVNDKRTCGKSHWCWSMFSDVPLDVTSLLLRYHSPVAVGIF